MVRYLSVLKTVLLFLVFVLTTGTVFSALNFSTDVNALGNIEVKYLSEELSGPLYDMVTIYPGDCKLRSVNITNNANVSSKVYVGANKISGELSNGLEIEILGDGGFIYKDIIENFYSQSTDTPGIAVLTLSPQESRNVHVNICMKTTLSNSFSYKKEQFDLTFNEVLVGVDVPDECADIATSITRKIVGSGKIVGTNEGELIIGSAGNDHIKGGGGNDCIFSYDGNDKVYGGNGNDVIILGKGNDHALGGGGNDILDGQAGKDNLNGDNGINLCKNGEVVKKCTNK